MPSSFVFQEGEEVILVLPTGGRWRRCIRSISPAGLIEVEGLARRRFREDGTSTTGDGAYLLPFTPVTRTLSPVQERALQQLEAEVPRLIDAMIGIEARILNARCVMGEGEWETVLAVWQASTQEELLRYPPAGQDALRRMFERVLAFLEPAIAPRHGPQDTPEKNRP